MTTVETMRKTWDQLKKVGDLQLGNVGAGVIDYTRSVPADLSRFARQKVELSTAARLQHPSITTLRLLRRLKPDAVLRNRLRIITDGPGVLSVLGDADRYRVSRYGQTMTELLGPFALGMDGADHTKSRAILADCLRVINHDEVRRGVAEHGVRLLGEALPDGYLDLVSDYSHPILTRLLDRWFGLPAVPIDPHHPEENVAAWATSAFEAIFLNPTGDRGLKTQGRAAMQALTGQAKRGLESDADTVATRLVRAHLSDPKPAQNTSAAVDLVALAVASVATVTESLVQVVDELLRRPVMLAAASAAAREKDDRLLWAHIQECLRFSPPGRSLLRMPADGDLPVLASTLSAMHDPTVVGCPAQYRLDRDAGQYLHFGYGPHTCLGRELAQQILVPMLGSLLAGATIDRDEGLLGSIDVAQRVPHAFRVRLEALPTSPPGGGGRQ